VDDRHSADREATFDFLVLHKDPGSRLVVFMIQSAIAVSHPVNPVIMFDVKDWLETDVLYVLARPAGDGVTGGRRSGDAEARA
jgi:hypothetical protein